MFKILMWGLVIYLVYRLIFNFVVPISKVASQMKGEVQRMQEQQKAAQQQYQQQYTQTPPVKETPKKGDDDYIEFEEVKGEKS